MRDAIASTPTVSPRFHCARRWERLKTNAECVGEVSAYSDRMCVKHGKSGRLSPKLPPSPLPATLRPSSYEIVSREAIFRLMSEYGELSNPALRRPRRGQVAPKCARRRDRERAEKRRKKEIVFATARRRLQRAENASVSRAKRRMTGDRRTTRCLICRVRSAGRMVACLSH
jgi:hypothetical protein